jgi:hypothetical protein
MNLMTMESSVLNETSAGFVQRDDFVARIIMRAWKDEFYMMRLLKEPESVLAEELGIAIPKDVEIRVLEETRDVRYIIIPFKRDNFPAATDEELAAGMAMTCPTATSTKISSPCDCG